MRIGGSCWLGLQLLGVVLCGQVSGQLTISDPDSPESIQQTSLNRPTGEGIVTARTQASSGKQIRVSIQYLMVDEATRAAIYQDLEPTTVTGATGSYNPSEALPLSSNASPLASSLKLATSSRITTCLLEADQTDSIVQMAFDSDACSVSKAPSVILMDGKEAEVNDVVQRPFVVDFEPEGKAIKPIIQVLDDGLEMRLLASLKGTPESPEAIDLTCEVTASEIVDIKADKIFGINDEPLAVQVPIHQVTKALASQELREGQTLLLDPHVTKTQNVRSEVGVPVLNRIPYVGRSFKNVSVGSVEQHMIVLLAVSS